MYYEQLLIFAIFFLDTYRLYHICKLVYCQHILDCLVDIQLDGDVVVKKSQVKFLYSLFILCEYRSRRSYRSPILLSVKSRTTYYLTINLALILHLYFLWDIISFCKEIITIYDKYFFILKIALFFYVVRPNFHTYFFYFLDSNYE